jgi:hypothetical protein
LSSPIQYTPETDAYKNIQKQVASQGVPVMTIAMNEWQRKKIKRQIISLYPDILNKNEAENVKIWSLFSQIFGIGMIFGTPYSLILIQKASEEASGSALRNRYMGRALGIQTLVILGSYLTYNKTMNVLDKYSSKYLNDLSDEELLNFEKQDPQTVNQKGNSII